jgi:cytoskeletal protein CcmA (bactofilin family)
MFDRGNKEADAGQTTAAQSQSGGSSAAQNAARRTGSGQFAIIGRSIQINGDVKGDEDLVIEGDVSGTVELRNHSLTIGKEGTVKADIYARAITVEGTTDGDLFASERISIRASANVRGNLLAPRVSLEDGARFKGSVEMDQQAVDKAVGSPTAKSGRTETGAKPHGDVKLAAPSAAPSAATTANG